MTNVYPSHPAGSFYYPERSSLPTIAAFTFRKEREYDLAEEFSFDGEEVKHVKKSGGSKNYNYYQVDKDEDDEEAAVIDFVPREEAEFEKEEEEERRMEAIMSNEIPEAAKPSEEKKHHKNKHHHGHHGRRHHGHHGSALRQSSVKAFRGGGGGGQSSSSGDSGYHASTGPADFFKKKYKSEILEVNDFVCMTMSRPRSGLSVNTTPLLFPDITCKTDRMSSRTICCNKIKVGFSGGPGTPLWQRRQRRP